MPVTTNKQAVLTHLLAVVKKKFPAPPEPAAPRPVLEEVIYAILREGVPTEQADKAFDRLRNQFNVSAAEVGHLDDVKVVELGVAAVGPEPAAVRGVLQTISEALRKHPVAEFLEGSVAVGTEVV